MGNGEDRRLPDSKPVEVGNDVGPAKQDTSANFEVRQVSSLHPDFHTTWRLVKPLGELGFREEVFICVGSTPEVFADHVRGFCFLCVHRRYCSQIMT